MPNWMSYAYCEKCDRPLRENEYRSVETSRGSNRHILYYCKLCDSRGRKLVSMLGFHFWVIMGWLWTVAGFGGAAWDYFAGQSEVSDVSLSDTLMRCFGVLLITVATFAFGWWQKSKYKPIYDRWVHQHGTDPDKWPDATKPQ